MNFVSGDNNFWMDDVSCTGTETNLLQCPFPGWGEHDCGNDEHAGVRCEKATSPTVPPKELEPNKTVLSREYVLDHNTSLSGELGELFDSGRDCDLNVTVMVDNSTVESVCVHRIVLSLNPNLRSLLINSSSLDINATSDCVQHVNTFVRYIYTRQITLTLSSTYCVLKMASDWGLTEIQNEAADLFRLFLPQDPTFQSQASFCKYALHTGDEALQETCLRYLAWNCEALIGSPVWTNLTLDLVKALVSRSDLVVQNETVILSGLERWAAAQGNSSIPEILVKLVRFPMIPAEDLYTLDSSRYHASKLQGFQFNAVPLRVLLSELAGEQDVYTSRIYTGLPWSLTFSSQDSSTYPGEEFTFRTPVHNSACFAFHMMNWNTRVIPSDGDCTREGITCPSLPAVTLKTEEKNDNLPGEMEERIGYSNKLVVLCDGRYVFHVGDFSDADSSSAVFVPTVSKQVYPCHSNVFSFKVVVRPQFSTKQVSDPLETSDNFR